MNLKNDIISILKAATEPMDRKAIALQGIAGTDKQIADQLYLLKKARSIIGEKEHGTFWYRMPTDADMPPSIAAAEVLRARSEAEVDEIELESIEDHFPDAGKMIAVEVARDDVFGEPAENGKRHMDVWPGPTLAERIADQKRMQSQPESDVSERSVAELEALHSDLINEQFPELNAKQPGSTVSENVEDETEEPIKQELSLFRVGVFNDGTMTLWRDTANMSLSKEEFAEMVEFARTVGWLPA